MAKHSLKIALLQHAVPDGWSASRVLDHAVGLMRDAAGQGATLLITQELFTTPYFPVTEDERAFELAEPIPGPTTQRLGELAKELGVSIAASLFEKRTAGVYHNTSVLLDASGAIAAKYRKMHIPDDPGFYEKYFFTPGDLGFVAADVGPTRAGMLVCWDQWFPEAARLTALQGAELLMYPTAIGALDTEDEATLNRFRDSWMTVQRGHAISNGVFVAAINRIGTESGTRFWGSSFVADPAGQIIAEAPRDQETVLVVDLDLSLIEQQRRGWPFLRDRRIDAYRGIEQRVIDGGSDRP